MAKRITKKKDSQEPEKVWMNDFAGGVNSYIGPRQIADNESPDSTNCDFKGKGGVGNRYGYTEEGAVGATYTSGIYGLGQYHDSTQDKLVKFASDGSDIYLLYKTEAGAWTLDSTATTFTDATNMDIVQALSSTTSLGNAGTPYDSDGLSFTFNGTDAMYSFNGTATSSFAEGTKGKYGAYYAKRLWCVDETYPDTLHCSVEGIDATKPTSFITNGTTTNPRSIILEYGTGAEITGLINFKDALYVFLTNAIYRITPASTANNWTIELITRSAGCVSHRSICQVEEDVYFASQDGVYSLGEVANYTEVRTTNKSAKVQNVFENLSAANKKNLVGKYANFKYHLFYSLFGGGNDSVLVYDIRYKGWQDWRNHAANDAISYITSNGDIELFFGDPSDGKVYMSDKTATDDDGTTITSVWKSKSYDQESFDTTKLYLDHTFGFGLLNGTVTVSVIFNDTEVSVSKALTQQNPQGGFGSYVYGRYAFGDAENNLDVTQKAGEPYRIRAKGQKFAVQYKVESTGFWRLDDISTTMIPFSHYKFLSSNKLN